MSKKSQKKQTATLEQILPAPYGSKSCVMVLRV